MTAKTPLFALASFWPSLSGLCRLVLPLVRERARFALTGRMRPVWVDGYLIDNPSKLICFWQEWMEGRSRERWQSLVKTPTPLILDIGANYGVMGWFFKKRWPGAKIVAFEPLMQCCCDLVVSDAYQRVHTIALGEEHTKVRLYMFRKRGVTASTWPNCGYTESTLVPMVKLDSMRLRPDLIKCDVDGDELSVVKGGLETFRRCPVSIIECRDRFLAARIAEMIGKRHRRLHGKDWVFWSE